MAKFATNARGTMLLLNLIQVTESISGSVVPLAMFYNLMVDGGRNIKFGCLQHVHVGVYINLRNLF